MSQVIVVAAVALLDGEGRMLTARKRGTRAFMNPGGKPEPGETPTQAAVREVHEELGVTLDPAALVPLGTWDAPAANEPGATVRAHAFRYLLPADARPQAAAEIDETRWVRITDIADGIVDTTDYAPLLVQHFVPALIGPWRG